MMPVRRHHHSQAIVSRNSWQRSFKHAIASTMFRTCKSDRAGISHDPSNADMGGRDSPQHLSWPLESTAQVKDSPHAIVVAVRPAPSETAGRMSPISLTPAMSEHSPVSQSQTSYCVLSLLSPRVSVSPRSNWPKPLYPAGTGFKISNQASFQPGADTPRHKPPIISVVRGRSHAVAVLPDQVRSKGCLGCRSSLHVIKRSYTRVQPAPGLGCRV